MFRPVRMKKLQIVAIKKYRDAVVKKLHEEGVVHISDYKEQLSGPEYKDLIDPHPVSASSRRILAQIMAINRFLDMFEMIDPEVQDSFFTSLFRSNPPEKVEAKSLPEEELIKRGDALLGELDEETKEPVTRLEEIEDAVRELNNLNTSIEKIKELDIKLEYVGDSELLSVFLGIFPQSNIEPLRKELEKITGGAYHLAIPESQDPNVPMIVICFRENKEAVLKGLRKAKFERFDMAGVEGVPGEALASIKSKLIELSKERSRLEVYLGGIAKKRKKELMVHRELLEIAKERADIQTYFARTETTVAIEGWVPARKIERVIDEVRNVASGLCVARAEDLDEPPEKTPVLLSNPPFFRSFETLTRLYGLPSYQGIDPTIFLVPGFMLFFGIMLTDAMYGLICLLFGILIVRGGGKHDEMLKDAGVILAATGGSTIVLGALTGGWFGEMGLNIFPGLKQLILLDPMKQAVPFLIIALSIGLIHINLGLILRAIDKFQVGTAREVIGGNFWILVTQPAVVLLYFGYQKAGILLLAIGVIFLMMSEKGMAMFAITGFLGDVLSYARLMALGLCTAGIAMTVNVLVILVKGSSIWGFIIASLIFLGGHLLNLLINVLGAFVHGIRLHYVEFFSKFYEGGGIMFEPFQVKRILTK